MKEYSKTGLVLSAPIRMECQILKERNVFDELR
jgi:hypothetical protein